jgi:hypothetical protein
LFASKDVSVDHFPIEAGSILSVDDIGQFCNNLYCEVDNLRVLCDPCHATHTLSQTLGITFEQARQEKKVIDFLKKPLKEVVAYCCHMGYTQQQLSNADKRRAAVAEILSRDTGVEVESIL